MHDFNVFVDSVIVAAADRQSGSSMQWLDLGELCREVNEGCPPTWRDVAYDRIRECGWGRFTFDSDRPAAPLFKLTALGISHASAIRAQRRIPSFRQRVTGLPVGKGTWDLFKIALGAILGAVVKKFLGK